MRRSTTLFIAFTFVAGGILGYLLRAGSGELVPASRTPASELSSTPVPPDTRESAAPSGPDGYQSFSDALASIPIPEHSPGTGTITGQVRLKEGGPLAGVLVRAERLRPRPGFQSAEDPPGDESVEALVREFIRIEQLVRSSRSECRTDAEGRYTLPGLANEKHQVRAYLAGYEIKTTRRGYRFVRTPGETGDFVAKPMVKVPVTVLLPTGEVARAAKIRVNRRRLVTTHTWTRESPEILIPPGSCSLQALAGPDDQYTSHEVQVEPVAGERAEPTVLQVEDLPGIMGKVIPPADDQEMYRRVGLVRVASGTEPSPDRLDGEGKSVVAWRSKGGVFAFRDLRPGTYLIGVLDRRRQVKDHAVVEVSNGMVRQDLRAAGPEPEGALTVRVEAPDGSPVVRAAVRARYRAWTSSWSGSTGAPQGDGTYLLPHREVDDRARRPGGTYYAEAFTRTYGTARVEYDPDGLAGVVIRYQEPAALDLSLTGYTATPYDGSTSLTLTTAVGADDGTSHMITDYGFGGGLSPEGRRQYPALQPGGYDLAIWVSTAGSGRYRVAKERLVLAPGPNRKTISLPSLSTLTVLSAGRQAGLRYRLEVLGGAQGYSGFRDGSSEDGSAVFRGLPPGEYALRAWDGSKSERMFVTVAGDRTVSFKPQEAMALRVVIHRRIGYFIRAGLRDGDLVIGIDGEEFTSEARLEAALALAREKPTVNLTILRGGSPMVLPVDLTKVENLREAGGKLEPAPRK